MDAGNFTAHTPQSRLLRVWAALTENRGELLALGCYLGGLIWLSQVRPFWLDEVLQLVGTTRRHLPDVTQFVVENPGGGVPLGYWTQHWLLETFGLSRFSARAASVLFAVLALPATGALARSAKGNRKLLAIAFALLPLQLRYAVEARPYSQALFFSVAALWCLWKIANKPSVGVTVCYTGLVIASLYCQPFSAFVQIGAVAALAVSGRHKAAATATLALAIAFLSFAPWYIYAHNKWHEGIVASHYPALLQPTLILQIVKELSGGGYVTSLSLLAAAALGWRHADRVLRNILGASIVSGIFLAVTADALFHYFFAARQLLFVLPSLLVLSSSNLGKLRNQPWRWLIVAIVVVSSIVKDISYFRSPADDWQSTASQLLSITNNGTCVILPAPDMPEFYLVFEHALKERFCYADIASGDVVVVEQHSMRSGVEPIIRILLQRGYRTSKEIRTNGTRLILLRHAS